jgi:hypothetical protein
LGNFGNSGKGHSITLVKVIEKLCLTHRNNHKKEVKSFVLRPMQELLPHTKTQLYDAQGYVMLGI